MLKKLPKALRNFYIVNGGIFLVGMLVLDWNDFVSRYKLSAKLSSFESEKEYYADKIKEVQKDHEELMGTRELLEKFAREKYLMKKSTEDIFVVVEE